MRPDGATHQVNVAKVFSSLFVKAINRLKIVQRERSPFWRFDEEEEMNGRGQRM